MKSKIAEASTPRAFNFVWFTDYKFMKYDDSPDSEAKTAAFRGVMLNPMIVVYLSILVISIILGIIRAN